MVHAYYMDSSSEDQRLPHQLSPPEPVSLEQLAKIGVLYWNMLAATEEPDANPELSALRKERGYTYVDYITVSRDKLPNYDEKLKIFYKEHLHTDEEIRFVLDGTGYFDVRDAGDRWIRIGVAKGDLIIIPKGIYHRFTLDTNDYLKAMRLFVGEPVWTPYNRVEPGVDAMKERKEFIEEFVAPNVAPTAA